MNSGKVQKCVEGHFPDFTVKGRIAYPYRNSKIFIFSLQKDKIQEKVVVKISRNFDPRQVSLEFENLSRFHCGCKNPLISSPEPLFVNPGSGILATRYINAINFSYMLHEIKHVSRRCQNRFVDLSALALARYHSLFSWPNDEPLYIDPAVQEDDINRCIAESQGRINECNLSIKVTPFFDFTPWNIMIERGGNKIYLIDFPRQDYVYTPHLDLARFRFSLELTKQFPPAKFLGINRWDVDELFDRFLTGYCHEMNTTLNEDELWLIGCFRKANIRRAQDMMRKGKCGLQPRLENAYLRAFSREWLALRGIYAEWPKIDETKKA